MIPTHTIASVRQISNADSAGYEQTTSEKRFAKQLLNYQKLISEKPSLKQELDEEIAYKELLQVLEEEIKSCGNKRYETFS